MERIVVTGYSIITPLGNSIREVWTKLCNHEDAVTGYEDLEREGFRFTKACRVPDFIPVNNNRRGYSMALQCINEALATADLVLPESAGIFIGSTIGESSAFEDAVTDKSIDLRNHSVSAWCEDLKKQFGTTGPGMAFGTACAAGNYAIGIAASFMRKHRLPVAVAGGAEPFSKIAMTGFSRSRAMTNDFCKPFDNSRNGMILGEGAAFFILETESHALKRGATPLASVGKLGLSSDAWHPTAPLPDGSGMKASMEAAIEKEGLNKESIDWICAHGSGTLASDVAEAKAISDLFGGYAVDVSAYKGAMGHSLGAATAIQVALCIESILTGSIAPTVNCRNPDPELGVNIVNEVKHKKINHVLNCGYAFGGINSALIISRY